MANAPAAIGDGRVRDFFVVLDGPAAVKSIPPGVDARSGAAAEATKKRVQEIALEQAALEPRLVAEGAQIVARLSRLANVIQVSASGDVARRLRELPGVRRVEEVPLVERSLLSAVPTVNAPAVWSQLPGFKGEGVTIGVIDSGIDYTHADFGGPGTTQAYESNDPAVIEPGTFPTAKVIGGWDFAGNNYNPSGGIATPMPDADPLDCVTGVGQQISGGHGTHVAGIAAGTGVTMAGTPFTGPYEASIDPSAFRVGPGVAPLASLFALKVFGCNGSTTLLTSALDRAADPNNDGSFEDRLDVVNGSLGTSFGIGGEVTGEMITELAAVGTLVVAAAGNDGQTFFATAAPGSFPEVLSVSASADNRFVNLRVTAPGPAVYPAAESLFSASLVSTGPKSGTLVAADPILACEPLVNAAEVAGNILLVDRGICPFVDKAANAVAAGALGVVVVDNVTANLPFAMPGDPGSSSIPALLVTLSDGGLLKAALANGPVTVGLDPADIYTGPGAELLAGFSSRGPSAVDGRLKPEISAPGLFIDSAGVGSGTEPRSNQGTSMASPMVAGAAALVRQARPDLLPLEVKALMMSTTAPLVDFSQSPYTTTVAGAGRVDVEKAVASPLYAAFDLTTGEIGVSFGALVASEPQVVMRDFTIHNPGATAETVDLSVEPTFTLPGVAVTAEPAQVSVPANGTASATLTLSFDPELLGDAGPDPGTPAVQGQSSPQARHYLNQATGHVRMQGPASDIRLAYTGSVRAASAEIGRAPAACTNVTNGDPLVITREDTAGSHPAPVVTAFQLAGLDDADERSATDPNRAMTDLRAVGIASNLASVRDFDDAFVYFGIAVEGPWTTPARGPLSVVKVRIDTNGVGQDEYEVRVEARNPDGPFRDALVSSLYDLETGQRGERYPVNVVLPDIAHTYPFNSTVLVLSVNLDEIGLDASEATFHWTVATERPDLLVLGADEIEGTFDPATYVIDTARFGLEGEPIFLPGESIRLPVSADVLGSGMPLDVLLLAHTNPPGEQWQVVSALPRVPGDVGVTVSAPEAVAADGTAEISIEVTSTGGNATDVTLTGTPLSLEILSATSSTGTCTVGSSLTCALGDLAADATADIVVTVRPVPGASTTELSATVASAETCEPSTNNMRMVTIAVTAADPDDNAPGLGPELVPSGGCGCVLAGEDREISAGWLGAALLGLAALRRRRRG